MSNKILNVPVKSRKFYTRRFLPIITVVFLITATALAVYSPQFWQIGKSFLGKAPSGNTMLTSQAIPHPINETFRESLNSIEWKEHFNVPSLYVFNRYFSSLNEAAFFFGIEFPNNTMLTEEYWLQNNHNNIYSEPNEILKVDMDYEEKDEISVSLRSYYKLENDENIIGVWYRFAFGSQTEPVDFPLEFGNITYDEKNPAFQYYTSSVNGIEAILFAHSGRVHSYFSLNNIIYQINFLFPTKPLDDPSERIELLKQIIDAFAMP